MTRVLELDVSDLEPPHPLNEILTSLQRLPTASLLQVHHRRDPVPLYPMLEEMGFSYRRYLRDGGAVTLLIWPRDDDRLTDYGQQWEPVDAD